MKSVNSTATTIIDETAVQKLMRHLEGTADAYSCSETFDMLDEYAELAVSRENAELLMPLVQHHLDKCPGCNDRYEALLRILKTITE